MLRKILSCVAVLSLVAACGASDAVDFNVNTAPGYKKDGNAISVFGVFRDGRMNPESWEEISPKFSGFLHNPGCGSAINSSLRASSSPIYSAVDEVSRSDGITDDLLKKFEGAALGDSILVVIIDGKTSKPKDEPVGSTTTTQMGGGMGRGGGGSGMGGRGGGMQRQPRKPEAEKNVFEMAATLYSKRMHQSAAMVTMAYDGPSEDVAVAKFVAKLNATFPSATCAGWNPDLGVDADALRAR